MSVKDTGVRALTLWPSYDQTVMCFPVTVFTIKVQKVLGGNNRVYLKQIDQLHLSGPSLLILHNVKAIFG